MSLRATRAEINKNALINNLSFFYQWINHKKICLAVKANAYGHGLIEISQIAEEFGVDYLAVATVDEGIQLRNAQIHCPILVLSPTLCQEISLLVQYQLTPLISHLEFWEELIFYSRSLHTAFPIHIKIDTGMHRAGFLVEDALRAIQKILQEPSIKIEGICTHFYGADDLTENGKNATLKQITIFDTFIQEIQHYIPHQVLYHSANTSGTLYYPQSHYDMVRIGLGAYGYPCHAQFPLQPIMNIKSKILQIKHIHQGDTVSYGATWTAPQNTTIALIPIGYGDGIPRALSNCGYVKIHDQYFPIVGRICMDTCMVDIGNNKFPRETEVLIFGDDMILNAHTLAEKINTIPYEIITNISDRIYRKYY